MKHEKLFKTCAWISFALNFLVLLFFGLMLYMYQYELLPEQNEPHFIVYRYDSDSIAKQWIEGDYKSLYKIEKDEEALLQGLYLRLEGQQLRENDSVEYVLSFQGLFHQDSLPDNFTIKNLSLFSKKDTFLYEYSGNNYQQYKYGTDICHYFWGFRIADNELSSLLRDTLTALELQYIGDVEPMRFPVPADITSTLCIYKDSIYSLHHILSQGKAESDSLKTE